MVHEGNSQMHSLSSTQTEIMACLTALSSSCNVLTHQMKKASALISNEQPPCWCCAGCLLDKLERIWGDAVWGKALASIGVDGWRTDPSMVECLELQAHCNDVTPSHCNCNCYLTHLLVYSYCTRLDYPSSSVLASSCDLYCTSYHFLSEAI